MNKFKILNDPIYGFINIPSELVFDIIEHPFFQRLRRISQMGLSHFVYQGAHHTRFEHALGAMFLMQRAISSLRKKGVKISENENDSLLLAILLHDIGHGPFSHTLEHSLVTNIHHEEISLLFMEQLNKEFDGKLTTAIQILKGQYHRKFLNQLVSSQLDIDRLDYLKRDSFYTGVTEGNINSERIISMLNVVDDSLVVEEKGIYSVEKFIVARRLMYWMVYLHKTSLVADFVLLNILKKAKELVSKGAELPCSGSLQVFLKQTETFTFNDELLLEFSKIDDYDIIMALKQWKNYPDKVLATLSNSIINRKLPKISIQDNEFSKVTIQQKREETKVKLAISDNDVDYFFGVGMIENQAYNLHNSSIDILLKSGEIKDITEASDHMNLLALSKPVVKHFMYYPK
ncbi:MAG: HD domain-containing protein [Flavobacteriaceae bacterium]|nr:HD domain-containing protein [Flavobacteriaceae bacterium]